MYLGTEAVTLINYLARYRPGGGGKAGVRLDDDLLGVLRPLQPRLLRLLVPLLLLLRLSHLPYRKIKIEAISISDCGSDPCRIRPVSGSRLIRIPDFSQNPKPVKKNCCTVLFTKYLNIGKGQRAQQFCCGRCVHTEGYSPTVLLRGPAPNKFSLGS